MIESRSTRAFAPTKARVKRKEIRESLGERWAWLVDRLHGQSSIREIADETGAEPENLKHVVSSLVEKKMITFHVEVDL